jgi:2-polyprenyl-3-methyl-5-hydroxy-6-metoxy-1,4-benzoquinol methylase
MPYLSGERFAEDLHIRYELEPSDTHLKSRFEVLQDLASGADVLHLGCVDHEVEAVERKRRQGRWLHEALCRSARRCTGVDIQADGLAHMRQLGYEDVHQLDIADHAQPLPPALNCSWDWIMVPEVLEHIGDPQSFLRAISTRFKGVAGGLVITVPHAFSKANARHARDSLERINSDHRFWFTPYTLGKLVVGAGFSIERFEMCNVGPVGQLNWLQRWWHARHPMQRNNLVLIARF